MSVLNKIKEKVAQAKSTSEIFFVSDETVKERVGICFQCEHLFKPTATCKKCGCFVQAKAKLKQTKCPIDKW